MLFMAEWKFSGKTCRGFVKAGNEKEAESIMREKLLPECELGKIREEKEHRLTPQSITINFENAAQYTLF